MTASELYGKFNNEFGFSPWPKTYEVDPTTYANCCQAVFDHIMQEPSTFDGIALIALGINNGLMFKNVELILKR